MKKIDVEYAKELVNGHKQLTKHQKTFLKPCEKCGKFLLMDFEICPVCNHQQCVDDIYDEID